MNSGSNENLAKPNIQLVSRGITKKLRKAFYKSKERVKDTYDRPFHGFIENGLIRESLGPFPEYILPTMPCNKTLKGHCAPCFFSKLPLSSLPKSKIVNSLITQTKFIIETAPDILLKYQSYRPKFHLTNYDVVFCYATNGSFFSNYETNQEVRIKSLEILTNYFDENNYSPLMYLETCSSDFIKAYKSGDLDELLPYLKKLNTVILFGFESADDFVRNSIWDKNLSKTNFEKGISIARTHGLEQGAFIFAGFHSMSEVEIIADVKNSLQYLKQEEIMPVLMFPNLKSFTIPHLLYQFDKYNLIDPRTVIELFLMLNDMFESRTIVLRDCWLSGDLWGGPPASNIDIFNSKTKISCSYCSEIIVNACMWFRVTHDLKRFEDSLSSLDKCSCNCNKNYRHLITAFPNLSSNIEQRVIHSLTAARELVDAYLENELK
jgi:uncharacterized Fe-S cluster-containing MiaB family protein